MADKELSERSGEDGLNTFSCADKTPVGGAHKSEVRNLLAQIGAEYEAALRGLTGLAEGTSQHQFIHARMENMGKLHKDLGEIVGADQAIVLVHDCLNSYQEGHRTT